VIGCALADRIAAIAPVSGGAADLPCAPSRPVSVLIHHGRSDPIVAVERGRQLFDAWKRLDGCPGTRPREGGESCDRATDCRDGTAVLYCEFDGEHRWPAEATARIWEFFRTHPMTR
jgi:polyhydroxybutyrate depolymerase